MDIRTASPDAVGGKRPAPRDLLGQPGHWPALGFGAGLAPRAPGTAGTLVGVALMYALRDIPWPGYLALVVLGFAFGVWFCARTARALGVHDHPAIVWDEVIGYLVTMALGPATGAWPWVGFVLFRLFDIVKPWPISWLDRRVGGGFGIMVDDLLAAVYALATMRIIVLWFDSYVP
ncbi:MAG: phosphatidylglycerophosphatase A [Gammaproteobacteria bacterium]|nr:phosphatidylglycerophosphatase A [Gammaproteobacteria bacterium]